MTENPQVARLVNLAIVGLNLFAQRQPVPLQRLPAQ